VRDVQELAILLRYEPERGTGQGQNLQLAQRGKGSTELGIRSCSEGKADCTPGDPWVSRPQTPRAPPREFCPKASEIQKGAEGRFASGFRPPFKTPEIG
jgi:hypothetical protein